VSFEDEATCLLASTQGVGDVTDMRMAVLTREESLSAFVAAEVSAMWSELPCERRRVVRGRGDGSGGGGGAGTSDADEIPPSRTPTRSDDDDSSTSAVCRHVYAERSASTS